MTSDEKNKRLPALPEHVAPLPLDPLARYLAEVDRYPILTPEEEIEVARHYQKERDRESAQKLVLSNLRLVVKIAYEYKNAFLNILDLIQEGNVGLMRAVEKFDPERGVRFGTYAAWWVRAYLLKYILDNFRLVKIGTTQAQKKLFFNLMREKSRIEKMGFTPTSKMISERLDVKEKDVVQMEQRLGSRDFELDSPKTSFAGALHMDFLADDKPDSSQQVESEELRDILISNLGEFTNTLGEKERQIFTQRLFTEVPLTLQEIADQYGITRERIRQIENRVVNKLKKFFVEKGLDVEVEKIKKQ